MCAVPFCMKIFPQGILLLLKEAVTVVKGISRQVIVVQSPDQKLFDQAIFILNDNAIGKEGVTDEMLLKAADKLLRTPPNDRKLFHYGAFWATAGAVCTGLIWLITTLF